MHYDGGTILAIDAASRTGVADGVPGCAPALSTIRFEADVTDNAIDVWGRASRWINKRLAEDPPALVVVEQPVPPHKLMNATNHAATSIEGGLYSIFMGAARAHGVQTLPANIQRWRKYSLGKGNLSRDQAKAAAVALCKRLEWPAEDDNAAEAGAIWIWACAQAAPAIAMPIPIFSPAHMSLAEYRAIRGRAG